MTVNSQDENLENTKEDGKGLLKKTDLTWLFGSLPRKMSGQEFKDMVREGWFN